MAGNIEDYLDENGNVKEEFKKIKKCFLKDLPTCCGRGIYHERIFIDWKNTIGYKIDFIYNRDKFIFEILEYKTQKSKVTIKFNGEVLITTTDAILKCHLGIVTGHKFYGYKYNIDDLIMNDKCNFKILDRYSTNEKKRDRSYKCLCNKCLGEFERPQYNIEKYGCPICCNQKIIKGLNDIFTVYPWTKEYIVNINECEKYSAKSSYKTKIMCPVCKEVKRVCLSTLTKKRFGCMCNDGVSYPEKFLYNLLREFEVDMKRQYSLKTEGNKYYYDFYVPVLNMIIETHGRQHYVESGFSIKGGRNIKEEQINDKFKRELALASGVEYYIELDCRKSELEWIKNSILNSKLAKLFDLSNIDWAGIDEKSIKSSNMIRACKLWKDDASILEIEQDLSVCASTVRSYLKRGTELGICEYNSKKELEKRNISNGKLFGKINSRKVICINDNRKFNSIKECKIYYELKYNIKFHNISSVCRGIRKTSGGLKFRYFDEEINYTDDQKEYLYQDFIK